jgi:four helix bundle protein
MAAVGDVKELLAWQLANELRGMALLLTEKPHVAQHRRYCKQLAHAAASGPRHIAEGFARDQHQEFAQLVRQAQASEGKLLALFAEAKRRGFLDERECGEYEFLARRAMTAATGLIRYLENSRGK